MLINSPYFNFTFDLSSKLTAESGYRYTNNSEFGHSHDYSLSASYFIKDNLKIYSNWSTAFKAPLLSQLYGPFGANPDLEPQESWSWQTGVQYYGDKYTFSINTFYYDFNNLIIFGPDFSYDNLDEAENWGVELSENYQFNDKLSATFSYVLLGGNRETTGGATPGEQKNNLLRRPEHQFDLSANIKPSSDFNLNISARYVAKREDLFFDPVSFENTPVQLDPYLLINFNATYQINDITRFNLSIRNLSDTDFYEVYGFNSAPINYMAGISMQL